MSHRYAYFEGCSARGTCRELDQSTRLVAERLGIELVPLENAGCTGARQLRAVDERLHLAANARILALAEQAGADLMVVCDTCLLNLTEANTRLRGDEDARAAANRAIGRHGIAYAGGVEVVHFLWVLLERLGADALRGQVTRPLTGLRVGPFYGCHIRRPARAWPDAPPERDVALERLCEVLGATPVPYAGADGCCGFHALATAEPVSLRMSGGHLGAARAAGADCLVTPCPLCHTVLDAFQPDIERTVGARLHVPVLHVAQLVGLAMGFPAEPLGLTRHVVEASGLI